MGILVKIFEGPGTAITRTRGCWDGDNTDHREITGSPIPSFRTQRQYFLFKARICVVKKSVVLKFAFSRGR